MAFKIDPVNSRWLYLISGQVRLPPTGAASQITTSHLTVGIGPTVRPAGIGGLPAGRQLVAYLLAQDEAISRLKRRAQTVVARIVEVDIPSGDLVSLMRVAQPSARDYWTGQAGNRAERRNYLTWVANLSHPQVNRSEALLKTGTSEIDAGDYTIKLTMDGESEYTFDMTVDYDDPFPDDNEAILNRLGQVIEAASPYLTTEVTAGTTIDDEGLSVPTVSLVVSTRQAGTAHSFTLEDASGDLIETLGVAASSRGGADLLYIQGSARATPYQAVSSGFWKSGATTTLTPTFDWLPPLASPQINQSPALDPQGMADLPAGEYRFKLEVGDKSSEIDFSIDYGGFFGQDNASVLTNLALAIESASNDLRAEVIEGESLDDEDQSARGVRLIVSNRYAASGQVFSLNDIEGDLMARLDLNRISRPATPQTDALAGRRGDGPADRFSLDETRLATQAHQMFTNPTSLLVSLAQGPITAQVSAATEAYNQFIDDLVEAEAYIKPTTGVDLVRELQRHSRQYAEAGVSISSTGRLSLDSDFAGSLERDVDLVRERLEGAEGLLTIINRHMASALAGELESDRIRKPGRVFDSAASGVGLDSFSWAALFWAQPPSTREQFRLLSLRT